MKHKNVSTSKKQRWAILAAVILIAVGLSTFLYARQTRQTSDDWRNDINYSPATDAEKEYSEAVKDDIVENDKKQDDQPQDAGAKKRVLPQVSSWAQRDSTSNLTIGGYVDGVIEDGGSCTVVLTKGGQEVSASREGLANAQSTACGSIVIEKAKIEAGNWSVVLRYSSKTSEGISDPVSIEVL